MYLLSLFIYFLFLIANYGNAKSSVVVSLVKTSSSQLSSETITEIKSIVERDEFASRVGTTCSGLPPAVSCKQMAELNPDSSSGYYWIQGRSGLVSAYCEINPTQFSETGGWMRIANVDLRNNRTQCPFGLRYDAIERKHLCRRFSLAPGCTSVTFPSQGVKYSKVCGKVIGYQFNDTNGFGPTRFTPSINRTYVDGVSITRGSPRKHILWTFASATTNGDTSCPCIDVSQTFRGIISSFVGNDYFCETGSYTKPYGLYYLDDPLWDSKGCTGSYQCCYRGGPWFCKDLEEETSDDIELRVCTNCGTLCEDVLLEQIQLYVH